MRKGLSQSLAVDVDASCGANIAGRDADEDFELAWLDAPSVGLDVPVGEGAAG
jgi:hypothetical protein